MAKFLFATDLHGDLGKYRAVVNHCNSNKIDALLLGGDLVDGETKTEVQGQRRKVPAHSLFFQQSLEAALSEQEREQLQSVQSEEQKGYLQSRAIQKYRNRIIKEFRKNVEENELEPIKQILGQYRGRKISVEGNHDPNFVKSSLERIVDYIGNELLEVRGIKITGAPACYEPPAVAAYFPELYPHNGQYTSTNDAAIAQKDFSREDDSRAAAHIHLYHKGITNRFSPDRADGGNTHDYNARRLVEIARAKGRDPLVLCGHYHPLDGGMEKGTLQLRPGNEYVYELVYDDRSKKLTEIVLYQFVEEQVARRAG